MDWGSRVAHIIARGFSPCGFPRKNTCVIYFVYFYLFLCCYLFGGFIGKLTNLGKLVKGIKIYSLPLLDYIRTRLYIRKIVVCPRNKSIKIWESLQSPNYYVIVYNWLFIESRVIKMFQINCTGIFDFCHSKTQSTVKWDGRRGLLFFPLKT